MSTVGVDLVCEGGGVRGIGLVGAVDALAAAGYRFPRVAGTSAGAIVASLIAALQAAGEPLTRLAEIMRTIDYRKLLDRNLIGHVPLIGGGLSLLVSDGVYRGAYLEQLLAGLLGVSNELREAAISEGANRWQVFWHVTLPGIRACS